MKSAKIVLIAIVPLVLAGCFSFSSHGMLYFEWGYTSGHATILRHASRDAVTWANTGTRSDYRRGEKAAGSLRTATNDVDMPDFFRDRWTAATHSDQYNDIGEQVRLIGSSSKCLQLKISVGWGDIGYDWKSTPFGGNCTWGVDPVPGYPS